MGRLVGRCMGTLALFAVASGCTSFAEEPPALMSDGDTAGSSTSGGPGGNADTTGASGGASMTSPTSAPATTLPNGTTSTAEPDPSGDPSGDPTGDPTGDADPSRAEVTGSGEETGVDPTDSGDSGDPTSGGQDLDGCETTQLAEQILECSENSFNEAVLRLNNNCGTADVDVYWVRYNCTEAYLGTLGPGLNTEIDTFATHPFRVRNSATGALLVDIAPLSPGTTDVDVL